MKKAFSILFLITATIALISWSPEVNTPTWSKKTPLSEVMVALGEPKPHHYREIKDESLVQKGFEIITKGKTTDLNGKKSKVISKHFVCTDCHNIQREDPDLSKSNPEARLKYAINNKIPFLQGTTLWGIVNRRSWYNEDYIKKYGDLVLPTNDTLINAIQLCCQECSQGRKAEDWEVEAMLAYFYSNQITLGDLDLNDNDISRLANSGKSKKEIDFLRTKYLTYSPATFLEPSYGNERKYGENGDTKNGEEIYNRSCMHCHDGNKHITNMTLNNTKLDYKFLKKHLHSNEKKSTYVIVRRGTYAKPSYKPYMPLYTKERMSDKQLEDLAAFLLSK